MTSSSWKFMMIIATTANFYQNTVTVLLDGIPTVPSPDLTQFSIDKPSLTLRNLTLNGATTLISITYTGSIITTPITLDYLYFPLCSCVYSFKFNFITITQVLYDFHTMTAQLTFDNTPVGASGQSQSIFDVSSVTGTSITSGSGC